MIFGVRLISDPWIPRPTSRAPKASIFTHELLTWFLHSRQSSPGRRSAELNPGALGPGLPHLQAAPNSLRRRGQPLPGTRARRTHFLPPPRPQEPTGSRTTPPGGAHGLRPPEQAAGPASLTLPPPPREHAVLWVPGPAPRSSHWSFYKGYTPLFWLHPSALPLAPPSPPTRPQSPPSNQAPTEPGLHLPPGSRCARPRLRPASEARVRSWRQPLRPALLRAVWLVRPGCTMQEDPYPAAPRYQSACPTRAACVYSSCYW